MSSKNINRRDFLMQASMAAVSCALFKDSIGQSQQFVIAKTAFGKIRGIESRGIKIFKGIPYGATYMR